MMSGRFRRNVFVGLQNTILVFIAFFCANSASKAACDSNSDFRMLMLSTDFGNIELDIPQDTPDGTMIYEKTMGSLPDTAGRYSCDGQPRMGLYVNSSYSGQPFSGTRFRLLGTGLSWFIRRDSTLGVKEIEDYYSFRDKASTDQRYLEASTYTFGLVKTGPISSNTKLINGELATYRKEDLVLVKFDLYLRLNQQSASCKTPNVQVNMGADHKLNAISNKAPPPVDFTLDLFDCPRSIKAVSYTFKANTAIIDSSQSIVALSPDSTARGLGLQLFNENGQPIALDKSQLFTGYTSYAGGNYKIPFKAAYYRIPGQSLKAGTADSSITFIMSYL